MDRLARLERENNLRSVWPNEAADFTGWLAAPENTRLLADTLGIKIEGVERESQVGDFRVDIFAHESATGKNIIIENQIEDANQQHLGKLLLYAAGKDASLIIWIVKHARQEYRSAIAWLNSNMAPARSFFLVEIELWRIEGSRLAPKFHIVESPCGWEVSQNMGRPNAEKSASNSDVWKNFWLEFWTEFKKFAEERLAREAGALDCWPDFKQPPAKYRYKIGASKPGMQIRLSISVRNNEITSGIYLANKTFSGSLEELKNKCEETLNCAFAINSEEIHSRIFTARHVDVNDKNNWPECFAWLYGQTISLCKVIWETGWQGA